MKERLTDWNANYQRIISAPDFDSHAATALTLKIQKSAGDASLLQAAAQALPCLRLASGAQCGQSVRAEAESRFRTIGQTLEFLSKPRFGKRGANLQSLSVEESFRARLGLPFGRRLFGPEINHAYKRQAKLAHPDVGGSPQDFLALVKARDFLLKAI